MTLESPGVLSVLSFWILAAKANIESVVFVHNLFGNPMWSWRTDKNIFWPIDFLAQDREYARLWNFGWIARIGLTLPAIANNLAVALSQLIDNRRLEGESWSEVGPSGFHKSITLTKYCVHKER